MRKKITAASRYLLLRKFPSQISKLGAKYTFGVNKSEVGSISIECLTRTTTAFGLNYTGNRSFGSFCWDNRISCIIQKFRMDQDLHKYMHTYLEISAYLFLQSKTFYGALLLEYQLDG